MGNISGRLIKGSVWVSAARAVVNGLQVLSTLLLARLLVPDDFGVVALAMTILVIMSSITELSMSSALIHLSAPSRSHFDTAWTLNALRGLVLGALFAAAGGLTANIYEDPRLTGIMAALGVSVFLSGLTNPRSIMLQRELIFWQEFVLHVTQKLAGVAVSIAIAYYYKTYWALVIGTVAMQVTNVIVSYTILPFRPRISFSHLKELFSFSAWLTAGQIVNTLNWRFDYLLIGKGLGMVPLGYYSVGCNLAQVPTRETTSPLTKVIFPGFASIREDRSRLAAAYQRAQSLVTAVALPAGIGAALVADPLIRLTMGEKWAPTIFIVQVLAAVFALQTLGSLSEPLGMASGNTRLLFVRNLQMLLIRVPIIIAGMVLGGLKGVVVARVITGVVAILFNMRLVRRFTGLDLRDQLAANVRAFVSSAMMVGGVVIASSYLPQNTDPTSLFIKIGAIVLLAVLIYCASTVLLWMLMGKPSGPESEVGHLGAKMLTKFKAA